MTAEPTDARPPAAWDAPLGPRMPALRKGVAILQLLASHPHPVSAGAIARHFAIPRSSTYQLLQVLVDEGLVVHIPDAQGYKLGVGVFELGSAYLRHEPLEHLARPILLRLVRQLGLTVHLGVLSGHESLYLLKEEPRRPTKLVTEVGVRLPAHLTATGRAILCLLPKHQVAALYSEPRAWASWAGRGPQTLRQLRSELAVDRTRGYALEDGHITDGVTCIAAAALDHNSMPTASFSVSFRSGSVPPATIPVIGQKVVEAASRLSARLGGART